LRNVLNYIVGGFHDPRYESLTSFLFSLYQFQVLWVEVRFDFRFSVGIL